MGSEFHMIENRYQLQGRYIYLQNNRTAIQNYIEQREAAQEDIDLDRQTDAVAADMAAKLDSELEKLGVFD